VPQQSANETSSGFPLLGKEQNYTNTQSPTAHNAGSELNSAFLNRIEVLNYTQYA